MSISEDLNEIKDMLRVAGCRDQACPTVYGPSDKELTMQGVLVMYLKRAEQYCPTCKHRLYKEVGGSCHTLGVVK